VCPIYRSAQRSTRGASRSSTWRERARSRSLHLAPQFPERASYTGVTQARILQSNRTIGSVMMRIVRGRLGLRRSPLHDHRPRRLHNAQSYRLQYGLSTDLHGYDGMIERRATPVSRIKPQGSQRDRCAAWVVSPVIARHLAMRWLTTSRAIAPAIPWPKCWSKFQDSRGLYRTRAALTF
jgi:hypothetical protein